MAAEAWIGGLLVGGFVLFVGGVILPERGGIGRRVWSVPHEEVSKNPGVWRTANTLFTASSITTTVGFLLLAMLLHDAGSQLVALVSAVLFLVANVLWIIFSAFRTTVIPWAADNWKREGETPPAYAPLSDWAYLLGSEYMLLGYLAIAALGAAILETNLLPTWIAWIAVISGLGLAGVMTVGRPRPRDQEGTIAHIPAWVQIIPVMIGIVLIIESL